MKFLEKDLEDIIYDKLKMSGGTDDLFNRGLQEFYQFEPDGPHSEIIKGNNIKVVRQLRIGNYGVADIVVFQKYYIPHVDNPLKGGLNINILIFELKKDKVCIDTLVQAKKCEKGIKQYFRQFSIYPKIRLCLIGSSVNTSNDWIYLFDNVMNNCSAYSYKYEWDGISFNYVDLGSYALTNQGFTKKRIRNNG
jgi:hypothetical protein